MLTISLSELMLGIQMRIKPEMIKIVTIMRSRYLEHANQICLKNWHGWVVLPQKIHL